MPSINLIAARREEKKRFEQYTRRLIYAIVGEVGVVLLVASGMTLKLINTRGEITRLDGQIRSLQPKVDKIQQLEADTALLKPKVTTLNEARNNTLYWYTSMQTVVACLPQQTWLTSMSTSGDPTPPKPAQATAPGSTSPAPSSPAASAGLSVVGQASTSDKIGETMLRMNQYANIASVSLGSVTRTANNDGHSPMNFSMSIQLKPDTAQDVPTPGFDPSAPAAPQPQSPVQTQPAAALKQASTPAAATQGGINHV